MSSVARVRRGGNRWRKAEKRIIRTARVDDATINDDGVAGIRAILGAVVAQAVRDACVCRRAGVLRADWSVASDQEWPMTRRGERLRPLHSSDKGGDVRELAEFIHGDGITSTAIRVCRKLGARVCQADLEAAMERVLASGGEFAMVAV